LNEAVVFCPPAASRVIFLVLVNLNLTGNSDLFVITVSAQSCGAHDERSINKTIATMPEFFIDTSLI
jgi:hypothetical protein